jgi:hypothetical protein
MKRQTTFSPCRTYRYVLWRQWDVTNHAYAMFIGLNPSTADEVNDDPTIRRCAGYARRWGYGALCVANLFAYRTPHPKVMKAYPDPVGADNDVWLVRLANGAGVVVAAWGVDGTHLRRDRVITRLLAGKLSCLRLTKDGHPWHPLYLRKTLEPVPFGRLLSVS